MHEHLYKKVVGSGSLIGLAYPLLCASPIVESFNYDPGSRQSEKRVKYFCIAGDRAITS